MIQKGKYLHYKGREYEVLGTALHSETLEELAVYRSLYKSESEFWVRPIKMFMENVTIGGKEVPRFKFIGN